jgi:putative ABC transport system permease protein
VRYRTRDLEVGVHRAFGASKRAIFFQHVLEAALAAGGAGAIAIGASAVLLDVMNTVLSIRPADYALDVRTGFEALGLSIAVGVAAALYPAWWSSRRSPAVATSRA